MYPYNPNFKKMTRVKEIIIDDNSEIRKDDFSKFFSEKLKELNEKFCVSLTKKELSEKLGLSYEQFRKIINREKPAKNRDCIIAVSALLGLDTDDTNIALKLNFMQKLDDRDGRDETIMIILDDHRIHYHNSEKDELNYDPDILSVIDSTLNSLDYPPLGIINHRNRTEAKENEQKPQYPYPLLIKKVYVYQGLSVKSTPVLKNIVRKSESPDFIYEDWTQMNRTQVTAAMTLDKKGHTIILKAKAYGDYSIENSAKIKRFSITEGKKRKIFGDLAEAGKYKSCFEELIKLAYEELKKSDNIYFDTKNFIRRASSRIIDGDLHVFCETFNYDNPMLNEYYLLDYCNGKYKMTVSEKSRFMRLFLPPKNYTAKYGDTKDRIIAEYDPHLDSFSYSDNNSYIDKNTFNLEIRWRKNYYKMLKEELDSQIELLKEKNTLLKPYHNNTVPDNLPDLSMAYNVLKGYDVVDKFQCSFEPNYELVRACLDVLEVIKNSPDTGSKFDYSTASEKLFDADKIIDKCLKKAGYDIQKYKTADIAEKSGIIDDYLSRTKRKPFFSEKYYAAMKSIEEYTKIGLYSDKALKLCFFKHLMDDGFTFKNLLEDPHYLIDLLFAVTEMHYKNYKKYRSEKDLSLKELINDDQLYNDICDYPFIINATEIGNPYPEFTLSDGSKVTLDINDLFLSTFMKLETIEEVGKVKLKHGSIRVKDLL